MQTICLKTKDTDYISRYLKIQREKLVIGLENAIKEAGRLKDQYDQVAKDIGVNLKDKVDILYDQHINKWFSDFDTELKVIDRCLDLLTTGSQEGGK